MYLIQRIKECWRPETDSRSPHYGARMTQNKGFPLLSNLPREDNWAVSQGERNRKPLFVRVNTSASSYVGHPDLPVRVGVAVPLLAANEHGLPGDVESGQLETIEASLFSAIQAGGIGRIVLIITTNGMREFVAYARSKEAGEAGVSRARATVKTHKLQSYTAPDPEWKVFRQFA